MTEPVYLAIDLTQKNSITLVTLTATAQQTYSTEGKNKDLLAAIDTCFTTHHITKDQLGGIMVVMGSGGFTSTRLAATVANTFAYTLQIPLLAITPEQMTTLREQIAKLQAQPKGQYLSATYSGEPNIGKKKE